VVLVPEAETLGRAFRDKYVSQPRSECRRTSLCYIRSCPAALGADVLESLHKCFARCVPFSYSVAAVRRFHREARRDSFIRDVAYWRKASCSRAIMSALAAEMPPAAGMASRPEDFTPGRSQNRA